MTCSKTRGCLRRQDPNPGFLAVWMLALNQSVKLGLWSIQGGSRLMATCGPWVILALQSGVVRGYFMPHSSRKQSSVVSDSEWRLVPPPSRQLGGHSGLMLWLSWARVCAFYKSHLLLPQIRVPIPFSSASNETKLRDCRILGEKIHVVWAVWSESS